MSRTHRYVVRMVVPALLAVFWILPGWAQYFDCSTIAMVPDSLTVKGLAPAYSDADFFASVRCVIHVLRQDDGSGGLSESAVDSMLEAANEELMVLGVGLDILGHSDVLNSTYLAHPDSFATWIFAQDPHENAIDIYLGSAAGLARGRAQSIPSSALVLSGAQSPQSALSHLIGHCLGLYHTSETMLGVENFDGSNGTTTGDLVSDTPADPGLTGWVQPDCSLAAAFTDSFPGYTPDVSNVMANSCMSCWSTFTEIQRARVAAAIQSYAILSNVVDLKIEPYVDKTDDTTIATHTNLPLVPSNAVAIDIDGDADKDIVVSGSSNTLDETLNKGYAGICTGYATSGAPTLSDRTIDVFGAQRPANGTTGLIAADYDNDSAVDFFAPNPRWNGDSSIFRHRLFRNDGDGGFTDVTSATGLRAPLGAGWDWTLSGAWGDYNGDGYLDLLTVVAPSLMSFDAGSIHLRLYKNVALPGGLRGFVEVTDIAGLGSTIDDVRSVLWVDVDKDHDMDLLAIQHAARDDAKSKFYLNIGGHFSDETTACMSSCLGALNVNHVYAAPGDVDNDGDVDIVYHGLNDRGWLRNQLDAQTGISTFVVGWHEHQYSGGFDDGWPHDPMDVEVFDFDLDGCLDMATPTKNSSVGAHELLKNEPTTHHFSVVYPSGLRTSEAYGSCAADFHMDGFTDLFLAAELLSPRSNTRLFLRSSVAASGLPHGSHWVGIRLEDADGSCNFRGVGATVIVTAGDHRQAQIVDGGSGQAGQHDLDLVFGLGAYSGLVDVEIIWPCGQTQYETVSSDAYHTVQLSRPIVDSSSVSMYVNFVLGEDSLDWVFEWETATPGDNQLDYVEFPNKLPGYPNVGGLDASMGDVAVAATQRKANGTYLHRVTWFDRPCAEEMTAPYKVHSKVIDFDSASTRRTLYLFGCPISQ